MTDVTFGPSLTRFEVQPGPGVKVSKIVNLADDIALQLAAADVRMEAPVPGKGVIESKYLAVKRSWFNSAILLKTPISFLVLQNYPALLGRILQGGPS